MKKIIFHLAIPITDVDLAKEFYRDKLGAKVGRENAHAVILDFYEHQVVGHVTKEKLSEPKGIYPRHFGLIFTEEKDWDNLLNRCENNQVNFYQKARLRFPDEITEHKTFFLQDPFFNILEFKFYRHYEAIFCANQFVDIGDRT